MSKLHHNAQELTSRERIWAIIRRLKNFTYEDIHRYTEIPKPVIYNYVRGLIRAKYVLSEITLPYDPNHTYHLQRDCGVDAPRLNVYGEIIPPSGRSRMWQAMPVLGIFTPLELAHAASLENAPVFENAATNYCRWLARGGYLKKSGRSYIFMQAMRHGPRAPKIINSRQLYDPNTGKIMAETRRGEK